MDSVNHPKIYDDATMTTVKDEAQQILMAREMRLREPLIATGADHGRRF